MKQFTVLSLMAALALGACATGTALAQEDTMPAHPRFARILPKLHDDNGKTPLTPLTTWNGSFVYKSHTYNYNMVGTAPSTGTSTTVKTFLIPIALKYVKNGVTTIFSPTTVQSNGKSAIQNTINSPIFKNMAWVSPEGTSLGTTQYEDAFQRGNFWQTVAGTNYHVLLGQPKLVPTQTLTVPAGDGSVTTEFGITVGTADINWFDGQLQAILTKFAAVITPNTLPIFITYDSYLTDFGCCIGGYHSSYGSTSAPQAYSHFTYISTPGIFSQDVSALSHEVGEWLDDPLVVNTNGNPVSCGILETGDPEEGFSNYGAFPYVLGGFTYNLQDLVYLEYFGAPNTTSVDGGTESFHDNPFKLGICNNGG